MKLKNENMGKFIVSATHLGNVQDTPARLVDFLKNADLLIFEEAKPSRKLLKFANITRDFILFNEHKQKETIKELCTALEQGKTALYVSDQGCPGIADPGAPLIAAAMKANAAVQVIPGPSSITAALSASPIPIDRFTYLGFLPREEKARSRELVLHKQSKVPLVVLDTPYRLKNLLASCEQVFGKRQKVLLSMDISGSEEQHHFTSLGSLNEKLDSKTRLNFVLIIFL